MSSLREFMENRGISPVTVRKMEKDKIDVDVVAEMSDEDLQEYLSVKGDRLAVKAFARKKVKPELTETEKRKLNLIENLRSRMTGTCKSADMLTTDEEATSTKPLKQKPKKSKWKLPSFASLASNAKQAAIASKGDRAIVVGFCIYHSAKKGGYRQIRAPLGGGTRHIRVNKRTKKIELLNVIKPLFFPCGKNLHGSQEEFQMDVSTDVLGNCLMYDNETVENIMQRLGLKHLRCYLLAKRLCDDSSDSEDNLPGMDFSATDHTKSDLLAEVTNVAMNNAPVESILNTGQSKSETKQSDKSNEVALESNRPVLAKNDVDSQTVQDPHDFEHPQNNGNRYIDVASSMELEDLLARAVDESGIIQFGPGSPDDISLDDTLPMVREITVHRGLVCRDLIAFFTEEENVKSHYFTFEIKMLKEDGTAEVAEDNGGVMRDALTEFWETFYLQYTEGNTYKVPIIRHDMTEREWKAVAAVIRMGFKQEKVYPIKLAPPFMQQAIFGTWNEGELLEAFLKFVPLLDKTVLESALYDFENVDENDLTDVMERYEAKKLVNKDNIGRIVREIAHREMVQKPMFVADCFYKVLYNSPLIQEDMSNLYCNLMPSPKKVLQLLKFPEQMDKEDTQLSSHVKKLVREMDDPEYLGLFLRFCTGCDLVINKDIHIRFISNDVSENVRCPSSHTCGCVLEIPRSYAQDPYVSLKSDFLALLKSRYWQMDIV